jgi:hypothetical protein
LRADPAKRSSSAFFGAPCPAPRCNQISTGRLRVIRGRRSLVLDRNLWSTSRFSAAMCSPPPLWPRFETSCSKNFLEGSIFFSNDWLSDDAPVHSPRCCSFGVSLRPVAYLPLPFDNLLIRRCTESFAAKLHFFEIRIHRDRAAALHAPEKTCSGLTASSTLRGRMFSLRSKRLPWRCCFFLRCSRVGP